MGFSIDKFKSNLRFGLARPHSYEVRIFNPALGMAAEDQVCMMCESAELPGRGFATSERRTFGRPIKMPYEDIFTDLKLTFICSADLYEKRYFDKWQKQVSDARSKYFEYRDTYAKTITVNKLSSPGWRMSRIDYSAKFIKAWPLLVDPIPLSYKELNSYCTVTVTFAYEYAVNALDAAGTSGGSQVPDHSHPVYGPFPEPLPEAPDPDMRPNPDVVVAPGPNIESIPTSTAVTTGNTVTTTTTGNATTTVTTG